MNLKWQFSILEKSKKKRNLVIIDGTITDPSYSWNTIDTNIILQWHHCGQNIFMDDDATHIVIIFLQEVGNHK